MNKADLSAKWGKYCDVHELVDDVTELLTRYGHRNTEHGVCSLLDNFFTNKENLIKLFESSPHYIGNLRICTKREFERCINSAKIRKFFDQHNGEFISDRPISYQDDNGKYMMEYMTASAKCCNLSDLVENNDIMETVKNLRKFCNDGETIESSKYRREISNYNVLFRSYAYSTIQRDYAPEYDKSAPSFKAGMKTSRAFNAFCHYYGFDKRETYNKSFAQYADLVSALKRNMDFVISLNPLDYLTMSNGVSWHSCHNIQDGSWKGGCLSYMLDSTSIITYVVENINSDAKIHNIPKNYRQMIHYDDGMFMQNRLYPQGNDGATNLYDKFRGFIEEEFNEILGTDGEWDTEIGSGVCRAHIQSEGVHYRDYYHNDSCNVFYPHAKANNMAHRQMLVGHGGVCCYCGCEYTDSGRLSHNSSCVRRNENE